ncbi:hypothetical protein CC86DRAFT_376912 [Ophiobolus disseminans]|uniref:Uncharacterized protein n=1 Tax=Ophiobolus disseminans TaxID=1469910 RepID=A0A6A7ALF0_9PLEO|nr:hypothetical protein CC86DRAFT_376912 [Ophiobolus disseminans]
MSAAAIPPPPAGPPPSPSDPPPPPPPPPPLTFAMWTADARAIRVNVLSAWQANQPGAEAVARRMGTIEELTSLGHLENHPRRAAIVAWAQAQRAAGLWPKGHANNEPSSGGPKDNSGLGPQGVVYGFDGIFAC